MTKGHVAAEALGYSVPDTPLPDLPQEPDYTIEPLWHVEHHHPSDKSFLDIQNDVTLNDVHLAMREGFDAVEHVKRYTTAGMGIDQGKTGNINVIGASPTRPASRRRMSERRLFGRPTCRLNSAR